MVSFIKSVTFDCSEPLRVAAFWAEPAGWGGPSIWFGRVPEGKVAKNRQHFDLRPVGSVADEVRRLTRLGAHVLREADDLVVMADPEGNEFCVE